MLESLSVIVGIITGILTIIAGVYGFISWTRKKSEARAKKNALLSKLQPIDSKDVGAYISLQAQELSVWRLLGFRRDIHMMDVHVKETLEVVSPIGRAKVSSPPIPAEEVYKQIVEGSNPEKRIFIVEGNAGSGKSTMLKHWMLLLADRYQTAPAALDPIPIYLSLRYIRKNNTSTQEVLASDDLANCFLRTIPALPTELAAVPFERTELLRRLYVPPPVQGKLSRSLRSLPIKLFELWPITFISRPIAKGIRALRSSQNTKRPPEWIFLCDGLDEMPREQISAFVAWARGLPPRTCVVIATRPGMAHVTNLPRSREFSMCPFNDEQISTFIHQWFRSDNSLGVRFLEEIRSNKAVREIVGIPLLLTFLSLEVEVSRDPVFPKELTQSDLLLEIIEILLEKWDASKSARPVDTRMIQLGLTVFETLAVEFSYGTPIPQSRLELVTDESVVALSLPPEYKSRFLDRVETGAQVIQGNRDIGYFFIHKIFFDFFFSRYLISAVHTKTGAQTNATSI